MHERVKQAFRLSETEREFLAKLAARFGPHSIEQLNEGLVPNWNVAAASALLQLGLIEEAGADPRSCVRYAVTEAGRAALAGAPVPANPQRFPRSPRRAG